MQARRSCDEPSDSNNHQRLRQATCMAATSNVPEYEALERCSAQCDQLGFPGGNGDLIADDVLTAGERGAQLLKSGHLSLCHHQSVRTQM